jgi:recombination endonuclease VII
MGSRWTTEEADFLREAASSCTLAQLAEQLQRSVKAVRWECEKLGIKATDGRSSEEAKEHLRLTRTKVSFTATEQQCTKCEKWKPFSDFSPAEKAASGHASRCKQCVRETAAWRRENVAGQREKDNQAAERWRRKAGHLPQVKYRIDENGRECTACLAYKPWDEFYREGNPRNGKCKLCWREHVRKMRYAREYGITLEDYEFLEVQQCGKCAYCGDVESTVHFRSGTQYYLSIDHSHICDRGHGPKKACRFCIRGLLCGGCNRMIGVAEMKSVTAAPFSDYLARRPLLNVTITG